MEVTEVLRNASIAVLDIANRSRYLFYLANPYETMFPDLNVPRYITNVVPAVLFIVALENAVRLLKGKSVARVNDSVASLASGIFQDCFRLNIRSIEILCYCLAYENYRVTTLPWDSLYTWLLCALLVDWGFYWAHRLAHEVNIIWAVHQAHHSGEDFTLLTALRQAFLQPLCAWITYIPLALIGIPPQIFLTHLQLTELYMIWIHTEAVQSLGPLEYFINTPKYHRVHHGRNRKYIDKNYAGVLMIWDHLFGTFEDEDPDDPVVYGLVHPVESYNIFYLQFHSWITMFQNMYHTEGWSNKLAIPFKGPGWSPGKPRLGYIDEIPELKHPVTYWDPPTNLLQKAYVIWHFVVVLVFYEEISIRNAELSQWTTLTCIVAILASLTSIGFILENRSYALQVELLRCLAFFLVEQYLTPLTELSGNFKALDGSIRNWIVFTIRLTFLASALVCAICEFGRMSLKALEYIKGEIKQKMHSKML